MGILKRKKLHLFNSLDTLKILTFWKILQEKNIFLLDFDYKEGKKYNNSEKSEIEVLWRRLYDEYFVLRNDAKNKAELDKGFKELKLKEQIILVQEVYNALVGLNNQKGLLPEDIIIKHEQKLYSVLKVISPKIKPKLFDGIEANLKNIERVINAMRNTYNLSYKKQEKIVEKQIKNVYTVVVNAESWLERSLDVEDMPTSKWIEIEKVVAHKIKKAKDGK